MRCELRSVECHLDTKFVRDLDDLVDGRQPSTHVRSAGYRQQSRTRALLESGSNGVDAEGAVDAAFHVPARCQPRPRQQVCVMFDHGRNHDIVASQLQSIRKVIDGLGGVATDDGHIVVTTLREVHDRHARLLVGAGSHLRFVTSAAMNA